MSSKRLSDEGAGARAGRASGRRSSGGDSTVESFSSVPDVLKADSFSGASNSPPGCEPTPIGGQVQRKESGGSTSSAASGDGSSNGSSKNEATRRSSRSKQSVTRFGEFQSWESVAADEVPPSPAFVGNPRQRQVYLEAYAKKVYEEEVAARRAKGQTVDDTADDIHNRVAQLMQSANEMLPDYAPSPAKSLHAKSLHEQLRESWQGKDYYSKLMAQMASPSPARPNMRPPHMQRLHPSTNGAAAATNQAKKTEAAKQQAALANMSGNALNGFGGGGGGYLFANLIKPTATVPVAPVAPTVEAKPPVAKPTRKSGDMMPPPATKRAPEKSPEPTKSDSSVEMASMAESVKKIEQAMRRISMSPAPAKMAAFSSDSNSPRMSGVQLRFDSPTDSSVDVDAVLLGDDVDAMRKAIRDLRRENEELRTKLMETQREARVAIARVTGDVIARAKIAEQEFSRKF